MAECPQCQGRKGPFTAFVNRGEAGCSVEQLPCSFCQGAGEVGDYEHTLWTEGRRVRDFRISCDISLRETAKGLGCSAVELSEIERGKAPAHHDILIERIRALTTGDSDDT